LANKNDNDGWKKKGGTSGGNFRKPWVKPGDAMEGIFCGTSIIASKFGGQNMIASWRDMKTDEQFQTRFPAALQRKAERGEFEDGVAYKIVYVSNETTAKGFTVKTFDVFEQEPF